MKKNINFIFLVKEEAKPVSTLQEENIALGENIFHATIADQDQLSA